MANHRLQRLSAQNIPKDTFEAVNAQAAQLCIDLLDTDDQGCTYLDYLGVGFKLHMAYGIDTEVISRCYDFILAEMTKYESLGNVKLLQRYQILKAYFDSRLSIWL